ncbi:hypothetical protein KCMC57_up06860 [Kitasatospora sp. CMC57]|uniref:GH16 domain-containing protein n=1 Tax=Kitasatospora sp. CMC57 TaxID=3231513 RepID=A0AB33JSN0_9ACTN
MQLFSLLLSALLPLVAVLVPPGERPAVVDTRIAFSDGFDRLSVGAGGTWGWRSTAYRDGCTDNPQDYKLDHLTPEALRSEGGALVITARPGDAGRWNTGLLTTGDSCGSGGSGAQVRTGDFLLTRVRLPQAGTGAWPALWTWRDGRNELDVFEWHADRPHTLEFVNHVRGGEGTYSSFDVAPGEWTYVGIRFGESSTTWYVGSDRDRLTEAFDDGAGVGRDFSAYLVLSLSVSSGRYHRAPQQAEPAELAVDEITVYRGTPPGVPPQR